MQKYTGSLLSSLRVRPRPGFKTQGLLLAEDRILRCALGRSGIGIKRGEGDGITPRGVFPLLNLMLRPDRMAMRASNFTWNRIEPGDGWCDATGDRNYNRPVDLPYPASHEALERDDHLYDIALVMDHNVTRHMSIGGSAIFFHLAHDDYRPTEGCVAVSRKDMLWLLPRIGPETVITIG